MLVAQSYPETFPLYSYVQSIKRIYNQATSNQNLADANKKDLTVLRQSNPAQISNQKQFDVLTATTTGTAATTALHEINQIIQQYHRHFQYRHNHRHHKVRLRHRRYFYNHLRWKACFGLLCVRPSRSACYYDWCVFRRRVFHPQVWHSDARRMESDWRAQHAITSLNQFRAGPFGLRGFDICMP